jgi:DNA topoisomerase I
VLNYENNKFSILIMDLIIVESPTKSKTIQNFLGKEYKVLSSFGHVRDLPKSELGVDLEKDFEPKYIIPQKARKAVKALKTEVKKAKIVILATDEDREGESIAWHLVQALQLEKSQDKKENSKPYRRIAFHEITKEAILKALENSRDIDMSLVDAQQARRILDRIVGYKLSPFLWKKIARGLSAGRVQSVAVRLVVEREREIEKFVPREYWSLSAFLKKTFGSEIEIEAVLFKINEKALSKLEIKSEKEAENILNDLEGAEYRVSSIQKKETKRNPLPPFTTSTLQQEAWKKFHWPAKMTMSLAQQLYETGNITYHRTDSLNIAQSALFEAKTFIESNYGKNYWAGFFRRYKTKSKGAQEAHEAIRPAYPSKANLQKEADQNQVRLYDLIWRRFTASQMKEALFDSTTAEIEAEISDEKKPKYAFRASGQILKFDGFLKLYPLKFEEKQLPSLEKNEVLKLLKLVKDQHFTQPPARYTEASLIKVLEDNGIGRPSTYAPTLSTIQGRNYIEKNESKMFRPTEIGTVVNDLLVNHFPKIVDIKFTAQMEESLDEIARGSKKWVPVIKEFYGPFEENLNQKYEEVSKKEFTEKPTDKICPKCGAPLIIRLGKFGKFYACSRFPECKYTESLEKNTLGIKCPKCKKGEIAEKRTKKGKIFYGCSNWPECDFATWDKPTGQLCPRCDSPLVETKKGRIKCSNKECGYKE